MSDYPFSFLKYVLPERTDILENGMIRFTPSEYLNDPFELRPSISHLTREGIEKCNSPIECTDEDLDFSMNRYYQTQKFENLFHEKAREYGILSLTGRKDMCVMPSIFFVKPNDPRMNLTMWSHYAKEHTGFLIEFSHDFIADLKMRKVVYTNDRKILTFEDITKIDDSVFFEKSLHWEYENEWRGILPLSKADKVDNEKIHLFKFDKSKVKSITLGCRISEDKKKEIIKILRSDTEYKNTKIYIARVKEKNYELEFYEELYPDNDDRWTNNLITIGHGQGIKVETKPKNTEGLVTC